VALPECSEIALISNISRDLVGPFRILITEPVWVLTVLNLLQSKTPETIGFPAETAISRIVKPIK
jgi:hypothetical protein